MGADTEDSPLSPVAKQVEVLPENPVDPLKDILRELNTQTAQQTSGYGAIDYYGVTDPLASDMHAINQQLGGELLDQKQELKSTLAFGADKWGKMFSLKRLKAQKLRFL